MRSLKEKNRVKRHENVLDLLFIRVSLISIFLFIVLFSLTSNSQASESATIKTEATTEATTEKTIEETIEKTTEEITGETTEKVETESTETESTESELKDKKDKTSKEQKPKISSSKTKKTPAKKKKSAKGLTERAVPVYLWGEYVEYKTAEQKIIAKGNAIIEHQKINLSARVIQANLKEEKILAYGNVIFSQDEGKNRTEMEGNFLVYDMRTGEGRITDGYSEKHTDKGNEYYKIKTIQYHVDKSYAQDFEMSSCDHFRDQHINSVMENNPSETGKLYYSRADQLKSKKLSSSQPHWKIKATKATIYPRKYMLLHDVNYYIRGKKIWHQSSTTIPLVRKKDNPFKPGYSKSKGVYFTYGMEKYWNKSNHGKFKIDYSQKQGTNYSFSHNYQKNKSQTTTNFVFNNVSRTDPVTLDVIANYSESLNFTMNQRYTFDQKTSANMNLRYSSNRTRKSLTDNIFNPANQELNFDMDITQKNKNYDMKMRVKQRMDPDGEDYPSDDKIQVLDIEPEFTLKTKAQKLGNSGLSMYSDFLVGKYFERAYHYSDLGSELKEITTLKKDMQLNLYNKPIKILNFMTTSFKTRYRRTLFTTGEDKEVIDNNFQLRQDFHKSLYANFSYNHRRASGESPLVADQREDDLNNIRGDLVMTLLDSRLRMNLLTTNYDYMTNTFYGTNTSLNFKSRTGAWNRWNINLTGSYDLKNTRLSEWGLGDMELTNLSARYNIERLDQWKFSSSMYYDNIQGEMQNMSNTFNLPVTNWIKLSVNSRYDFTRDEFTQLDYGAILDLHCWEAKMDWSKQTEDFKFAIYLKVFPDKSINVNYDGDDGSIKPSFGSTISDDEFDFGSLF